MIVDSDFQANEVIIQNPERPCPPELLKTLGLLSVEYWGFDNQIHKGQIVVATRVMPEVEAFFRKALELKFPIERVVPVSAPPYQWKGKKVIGDNVTSGFDFRKIKEQNKISFHGQGLAFDVNPRQNPYIIYKDGKVFLQVPDKETNWDPTIPGTLSPEHPLVKLMEGFDWVWGGHWLPQSGRTDYMHFHKDI